MDTYRNFIDGSFTPSTSSARVPNLNPADTSDVLGEAPLSTRDEALAALSAAAAAYADRRATPPPQRGRLVARVAEILERNQEEMARLLTREEGKTLGEARGEVQRSINVLHFNASQARRMIGETIPSELPKNFIYTVRQPLGVVGAISPWHFPVAIPAWKLAPALVAGNTVVFKPATPTPATATRLVSMFAEAGLPKGVLNMVIGAGDTVGEAIVGDPRVRAVSFTGSNPVGIRLYEQGSRRGLRVQCEMGGKNPVVVLEDADLDLAVESTVSGAFGSAGQRCTATSRVVVVKAVAEAFVEKLLARTRRLKLGPGDDPSTDVGPLVDQKQMDTVLSYLRIGREEGAELLMGGPRAESPGLSRGYFVEPAIFDRTQPRMRIIQEEIFGPVLSIQRVDDFEQALEVANSVPYGLSSSIFSNDAARIFRFVEAIETGMTHVNSSTVGGEAHVPFGGSKATGIGDREQGSTTLDFYSELKVVYIDYTGAQRAGNLY